MTTRAEDDESGRCEAAGTCDQHPQCSPPPGASAAARSAEPAGLRSANLRERSSCLEGAKGDGKECPLVQTHGGAGTSRHQSSGKAAAAEVFPPKTSMREAVTATAACPARGSCGRNGSVERVERERLRFLQCLGPRSKADTRWFED